MRKQIKKGSDEISLSISLSQRMMSSRVHSLATKLAREIVAKKTRKRERMVIGRMLSVLEIYLSYGIFS